MAPATSQREVRSRVARLAPRPPLLRAAAIDHGQAPLVSCVAPRCTQDACRSACPSAVQCYCSASHAGASVALATATSRKLPSEDEHMVVPRMPNSQLDHKPDLQVVPDSYALERCRQGRQAEVWQKGQKRQRRRTEAAQLQRGKRWAGRVTCIAFNAVRVAPAAARGWAAIDTTLTSSSWSAACRECACRFPPCCSRPYVEGRLIGRAGDARRPLQAGSKRCRRCYRISQENSCHSCWCKLVGRKRFLGCYARRRDCCSQAGHHRVKTSSCPAGRSHRAQDPSGGKVCNPAPTMGRSRQAKAACCCRVGCQAAKETRRYQHHWGEHCDLQISYHPAYASRGHGRRCAMYCNATCLTFQFWCTAAECRNPSSCLALGIARYSSCSRRSLPTRESGRLKPRRGDGGALWRRRASLCSLAAAAAVGMLPSGLHACGCRLYSSSSTCPVHYCGRRRTGKSSTGGRSHIGCSWSCTFRSTSGICAPCSHRHRGFPGTEAGYASAAAYTGRCSGATSSHCALCIFRKSVPRRCRSKCETSAREIQVQKPARRRTSLIAAFSQLTLVQRKASYLTQPGCRCWPMTMMPHSLGTLDRPALEMLESSPMSLPLRWKLYRPGQQSLNPSRRKSSFNSEAPQNRVPLVCIARLFTFTLMDLQVFLKSGPPRQLQLHGPLWFFSFWKTSHSMQWVVALPLYSSRRTPTTLLEPPRSPTIQLSYPASSQPFVGQTNTLQGFLFIFS